MKIYELRPGTTVRHYKGGYYRIVGIGRNSEDSNEVLVVYTSCETSTLWVRPLHMFMDYVSFTDTDYPDIVKEVPRFTLESSLHTPLLPDSHK